MALACSIPDLKGIGAMFCLSTHGPEHSVVYKSAETSVTAAVHGVNIVKLHDTTDPNLLNVSGYGSGYITIGEQRFHNTVLLTPAQIYTEPGVDSIQALVPGALPMLAVQTLEILLIGTGSTQCTFAPAFTANLARQRVGVEFMDTPAACRTFNILVAEQRQVAALLFIE